MLCAQREFKYFFSFVFLLGLRVKCLALFARQNSTFGQAQDQSVFFVIIYGLLWCQQAGDVNFPST